MVVFGGCEAPCGAVDDEARTPTRWTRGDRDRKGDGYRHQQIAKQVKAEAEGRCASGADAANAPWDRASDELDEAGSRFALCQWGDEGPDDEFLGRTCYRRTTDVYCHAHNRHIECEAAQRRKHPR